MTRLRLRGDAATHVDYWEQAATDYDIHKLVWSFFADRPDRERDFLFRFDAGAKAPTLHIVSERPPTAIDAQVWDAQTKDYAPRLENGDVLGFTLRANATKRDNGGKGNDQRRWDVVDLARRDALNEGAPFQQEDILQRAGRLWLDRQGERHGFEVLEALVMGHRVHRFHKQNNGNGVTLKGMEFEGLLRVKDADAFHATLQEGIGPAKGFGFGLLLVRRA